MTTRRTAMKRIAAAAVVAVAAFYAPGRPWEAVPVVNPRWRYRSASFCVHTPCGEMTVWHIDPRCIHIDPQQDVLE